MVSSAMSRQPGTPRRYGRSVGSTCTVCGDVSDDDAGGDGLPPGWSLASSARGGQRLCARCTRQHVRDIEAKLDEQWWS
jgi:hypothetical protein